MKGTFALMLMSLVSAGLLAGMTGCAGPVQECWHDKAQFVMDGIREIEGGGAARLRKDQLLAMMGKPDFRDSILAFSQLLAPEHLNSPDYRQEIMTRIWEGYRKQAGEKTKTATWKNDESFLKCRVWLYDEKKRFRSPLPHGFGYQAYYFLLRNDEVVGIGGIIDTRTRIPGIASSASRK